MAGDRLVVGNESGGAVYLFNDASLQLEKIIAAPSPQAVGFGSAIAASGDWIAISAGTEQAVYLYDGNTVSWSGRIGAPTLDSRQFGQLGRYDAEPEAIRSGRSAASRRSLGLVTL